MKNLLEWLQFLEQRNAHQPIQLGLERVKTVAQRMELLRPARTIITVAGTNGKGSTVMALDKMYRDAGYRVGAYVSPHIIDFRERILFQGNWITESELLAALEAVETAREEISLTYFEHTTLAAWVYFKSLSLDLLIQEVGMGGRLDATNVLDPDLAIITTVDWDHQAYLGNTLEAIAYEKAGIIRKNTPVIYGDMPVPEAVLKQADRLSSPLYALGREYLLSDFPLTQASRIHPHSAAAAWQACQLLQNTLPLDLASAARSMQTLQVPGRWHQFVFQGVTHCCDVAHNPQAAQSFAYYVLKTFPDQKKIVLFSALADKNIAEMVTPFLGKVDAWCCGRLSGPRAADENVLREALQHAPLVYWQDTIAAAYEQALHLAERQQAMLIVYGSFLTVSVVL
ncbi:MAG: folylpolyglutamate synthase/dihydrofolate synthase family protein [Legionellaceae bacterium]|nr:folylpolyglutamate synthase/dihydrofolate synthase family protein [Legionellaceae bacterium]